MSIGTTAALTIAGITAAGAVGSSLIGAHAAGSAADKQVTQENKALDVQQQSLDYTKQVESPYISAGNTSLSALMDAIKSGKFGAGSLPSLDIGKFTLPTAADAQATPGYQFALDQGELGVSRQAAAAGGAFTGGTIKAGAQYAQGLASNTYQQTVQNALAGYQTNTNATLQAYQAALAKQAQEYQQLYNPAVLGANAASSTATNVANESNAIGGTYGNIGTSQAAGIVGGANAITSGITGATNGISDAVLLQSLLSRPGLPGSKAPSFPVLDPSIYAKQGGYGSFNSLPGLIAKPSYAMNDSGTFVDELPG